MSMWDDTCNADGPRSADGKGLNMDKVHTVDAEAIWTNTYLYI